MQRQKTAGFTLIELLVVIAIIGILAAMLFPVFAHTRESAHKANCLSRVKQLTTALLMYMGDYDDRFPLSAYRATAGSHLEPAADCPIWPAYIVDYVRDRNVFVCPDGGPNSWYAETWADRGRCSLGINRDYQGHD